MIAIKLAIKNILGAGWRSLLNIAVLSLAFVIILWHNGTIDGWNQQARKDTQEWEIGGGQLWHSAYDPLDPLSIQDAHAPLSADMTRLAGQGQLAPILAVQASAFPQGRMQGVLLKGIDPEQKVLKIPTEILQKNPDGALIGKRMAQALKLKTGDALLVRWRDSQGAFDALELNIAGIFDCNVSSIDAGQIWLPIERLQTMMNLPGEATLMVAAPGFRPAETSPWVFQSEDVLLADLNTIIQSKKGSGAVLYGLLMIIALLAIFDTQVLSIFRRQREIGTYIALGMTRRQVIGIFTVEGSVYSILAIVLGALYGGPFLWYLAKYGWAMPTGGQDMGISISDRIYPVYGTGLVLGTIILVVIAATVVSFLPARKIARLNPTDAIKGKIQ